MKQKTTPDRAEEFDVLNRRFFRLAEEKSFLQLVLALINKMISVSGLDNLVDNILEGLLNIIGGTNLILYYQIDSTLYYADLGGEKKQLERIDDAGVSTVFSSGTPLEEELDFADTQLMTSEFCKAYTWIYPLKIGSDVIGVLKIENLHISMQTISSHLLTLFSYMAMSINNEILGQTRLKLAYDEVAREVAVRRTTEEELRRSQEQLEIRVEDRTAELKRANALLRASHESYRCIVETSSDGFWHLDSSGRILDANSSYSKLSGYSTEELLGRKTADFEAIQSQAEILDRINHLLKTGSILFETRHRRKDGTLWDVEVSASYLGSGDGHIFAFLRDITGRKRAAASLSSANALFQIVINTVPVRVFWKDLELRYLGCNRAFAEDAGVTCPGDVIGKDDYQFVTRGHADEYRADDLSVIESGIPKLFYDEMQTSPDGVEMWLRTSKVPLRNEMNEIFGVLGIYENITAYKRTEEALRESNEKFSVAFNYAPIMFSITRLSDGVYLDVNQHFLTVSGFSREEVIGRTSLELGWMSPANWNELNEQLHTYGRIHDAELCLHSKSNKTILCKYWGEIITVAGQEHLLSLGLNITEHRRVEQQLQQAQKMESVGRLAGGVAHDFNNMLTIINGYAQLALMETDPSITSYHYMEEVLNAANRSADVTRQLLAFARQQAVVPRILDLNDTVSGMLKMLRRLIGEDIDLEWDPGYELLKVKIDPTQLDQIMANLCVNARDAISGTGKISIRTENFTREETGWEEQADVLSDQFVMISVCDNGCGIPKDVIDHIFEPFYTTKEVGKGTGLGLAMVYGIVTQNGGTIRVYSEIGQGTTFRIYLPGLVDNNAAAAKEKQTVVGGNETILLVEDEAAIMHLGTKMLTKLGYTVLSANSPGEALRLAEEHHDQINLLLTDIIMPGMNGHDLSVQLLLSNPDMKCLFMSGYTADVMTGRGNLNEKMCFLQKPFNMDSLSKKIREALS
ncbi:MAG: PAS domain S-box protein [Desulfuromonadaceae bacterium]|nr:PAS domain S-box protein [Desulfuromonadaceae bacterium]